MAGAYPETAVITGAASGVGRELCVALARKGWRLGIVDIDTGGARETLSFVESAGGSGEVFGCDVRRLDEVQAVADHFFDSWGGVGLLVNNAGVAGGGCVGDIPMEVWENVIETDLWGVIYGCHAFIPRMKAQGGGHIVNIASMSGVVPPGEHAPYNTSKAAVIGLSETLKTELAPWRIGVTVACPMSINTNILKSMTDTGDFIKRMFETTFPETSMSAADVARKIVRGVERNKLYVFPQPSAKVFYASKRLFPSVFYTVFAFLHRVGLAKPIVMFLARRGWM